LANVGLSLSTRVSHAVRFSRQSSAEGGSMIRLGRRHGAARAATSAASEDGPLPPQLPAALWREIVLYLEFWQLVAEGASTGGPGG
jgi:hypothetical protein